VAAAQPAQSSGSTMLPPTVTGAPIAALARTRPPAAQASPIGRAARRSFQDKTTPTSRRTSIAPATMR